MSQNIIECGVGWRKTLRILFGMPMSTKMKSMHMMTAEIARPSPRMTIRPKSL